MDSLSDIAQLKRRLAEAEAALKECASVEAALHESEAEFRATFELSSVGQLQLDPDSLKVLRANRKACTIYGYTADEFLGFSIATATHPEYSNAYMSQIQRLLSDETEEIRVEKRIVTKYGAELIVDVSANLLRDRERRPTKIVEIVQDITHRRNMEQALHANEARLRGAFAISTVGIIFWRRSEHYALSEANDAFLAMINYPRVEAIGMISDDLTLPEFHEATRDKLRQAETGGGFEPYEKQMRRKDGSAWWGLFAARMVDDELVEFVLDVTERKRTDAVLSESEARQQVLIGELQHRTRNIIGVVRAMSKQTLRRSTDLADFAGRFSSRLSGLARVQNHLSRLADGERVTFGDLLRGELEALNGDDGRMTLQGPEDVALRSSTVQTFALALHELATNAVKYGAFSQPRGRLDVHWWTESATKDEQRWLHVDWRERDVIMPNGIEQSQVGSGRELIEEALPYQLGAETTYVVEPDGIHCTIALPVSDRRSKEGDADA